MDRSGSSAPEPAGEITTQKSNNRCADVLVRARESHRQAERVFAAAAAKVKEASDMVTLESSKGGRVSDDGASRL